jgi:NADH:ubiquinone oxidoreductase subunit E
MEAIEAEEGIEAEYSGEILERIQGIISENRGKAGAIIRVLEQTQGLVGYLPPPVLRSISREMKIPLSEVYGIVSFYHFFTMVPKGKYIIQVCLGTSCYVKGGTRILDALEKDFGLEPEGITPDGKFSLETVRCLGCCGLSPVMAVGGNVHRRVKPTAVKSILSSYE